MAKGDEGRLGGFTYYLMNVAEKCRKKCWLPTYVGNQHTTTHKLQSHRVQT